MPFCKRTILPKDVCKPDAKRHGQSADFGDLVDVCDFTLCSVLRQLSDLSRQSVSILEDLEGELVAVCHRSGALEGRVVSLQRHVAALVSKPPPKTVSGLEADSSSRRAGASGNSCHGNSGASSHGSSNSGSGSGSSGGGGGSAHFKSPWQQSVNVFGPWSRPECVEELHQQAQKNLQSLLQDFEEHLYDSRLTGQTFRHPSSQSSEDTPTPLCHSPVTLDDRRPDFIFLPASKQLYDDETVSSVFGLRGVAGPTPSPAPSPCDSARPLLAWSVNSGPPANTGPPVADKPRWFLGRRAPGHHVPLDITGSTLSPGEGGRFLGVDLLQSSLSPSPGAPAYPQPRSLEPRSLEPVSDTPQQALPLRKTHSDLDSSLPADHGVEPPTSRHQGPGVMDHSGLLYSATPSPSWNGPKGSTFSPSAWNQTCGYGVNKGPAVLPKHHGTAGSAHSTSSSGSHYSSFTSVSDPSAVGRAAAVTGMMGKRSETEGAAASPVGEAPRVDGGGVPADGGRGRERSARSIAAANAFKFRERSLSTPTDSGSFCLPDSACSGYQGDNLTPASNGGARVMADHHSNNRHHHNHHNFLGLGENYSLLYPSASSEDSGSTADSVSVAASDYSAEGRLRLRFRSISLKKSKRKPPPPVRSVSLMKSLGDAEGPVHHPHPGRLHRDGRPKSLHIPRDPFPDFQQDFPLPGSTSLSKPSLGDGELGHRGSDGPPSLEVQGPDKQGEAELNFPGHWQLGDWKNDPYRSLSGSSTATGTTVIECMKVRGSSESLLDSPTISRDASPSQFSVETDAKASSPFRPPGLMSPSSGYSSQSETPTPTISTNHTAGTGTLGTTGCKMRPKIPERKSSLPSPKDPTARSRLSLEMPVNTHPELSAIKPKQKASRRHSDTSTAAKPGKISPGPSQALPVVTQNELNTIRLRSVSRGDLDDCPDGASDTIEEEQQGRDPSDGPGLPPTAPKPKPPVALKPPLPRRPMNLLFKPPSTPSSTSPLAPESPPASPVERPVPLGNIYKVMRKPKPKRPRPQTATSVAQEATPPSPYDLHFLPHSQSLFDLPPLPDPQPLIEDPGTEPDLDPDAGLHVGSGDGGSLPSPCSGNEVPELQDKSRTLPSRMTISCLAELSEKKKAKVPPPVPKKPSVLLPQATAQLPANGGVDRQPLPPPQMDSTAGLPSPVGGITPEVVPAIRGREEFHVELEESSKESALQDFSLTGLDGKADDRSLIRQDDNIEDRSVSNQRTELHIAEETDDDVVADTPTTHTTEDLFTIIHRSKRKVLGRKEPSDSFGSRQSLVSPVKHGAGGGGDVRAPTIGGSQRSSSRNETFMALLQKKGSKSSGAGGARVSAMELLKSTNPLARRVTEFSSSSSATAPPPLSDGGQMAADGGGEEADQ